MSHVNSSTNVFARRLIVERVAAGVTSGVCGSHFRCGATRPKS